MCKPADTGEPAGFLVRIGALVCMFQRNNGPHQTLQKLFLKRLMTTMTGVQTEMYF